MAAGPAPSRSAADYWPRYVFDHTKIDLTHLNPSTLLCACEGFPCPISIRVTYSNHCFTDHFAEGVHDPAWKIMHGKRERVFCFTRHALSVKLPAMVASLPSASVWQARQDRNFIYHTSVKDEAGTHYPLFFNAKKDKAGGSHVALFVESAYAMRPDQMAATMREAPKVKFSTLVRRIVKGEPLNFRHR